ncbi:hypothetical protein DPSP01_013029 [Paraphaeosphaeria sporulosa]
MRLHTYGSMIRPEVHQVAPLCIIAGCNHDIIHCLQMSWQSRRANCSFRQQIRGRHAGRCINKPSSDSAKLLSKQPLGLPTYYYTPISLEVRSSPCHKSSRRQ